MFMHPWIFALGLIGVGLPVAIHFLTKPKPTRMPLSTIRFVRQALRQRRAQHRLRDWLILLLRAAAILLIGIAIARPQWGSRPLVSDDEPGEAVRVVILDASASMGATSSGVKAIEHARSIAANHLRYRAGLRANLIIAGARPRPLFDRPSTNFEALREALGEAQTLPEQFDVNRSVDAAAEMLAPADANDTRRRELVIVSDFQRTNWTRADFSPLPQGTLIQFESVAREESPGNLAVLSAQVRGRSTLGSPSLLEVEVGNYSNAPQTVSVEVTLGEHVYRLSDTCPAQQRTTLSEPIEWSAAGWHWGQARLLDIEDALESDNSLPLVARVAAQPTYAIISRQPASQRPSSSHYLACALVPDAPFGEQDSAELLRMHPSAIDREQISTCDLIVIDHPGKLSEDLTVLLADLLRRGRPIIYVASEMIDATNLKRLEEEAGAGLQMPVEFSPPPRGRVRRDLFLASYQADSRPFRVFGDNATSLVGQLRFAGGLSSRQRDAALTDDVLATYNDGTASLVMVSSERGALCVINADLNKSNLPVSAAVFVPMLQEITGQMLERHHAAAAGLSGEPLVARLPAGSPSVNQLRVVGPQETASEVDDLGELIDEGLGAVWRWQSPTQPGVYRVLQEEQTVFAMPVETPSVECNLESLSADVLSERLAAGRSTYFRSVDASDQQSHSVWVWILAGCVLCMLGEFAALISYRS